MWIGSGSWACTALSTQALAVARRWGWRRMGRDSSRGVRSGHFCDRGTRWRGGTGGLSASVLRPGVESKTLADQPPVPPEPSGQEFSGGDPCSRRGTKRIPGGGGDPFSLRGEKIPGSRRRADCGRSESGPDRFSTGRVGRDAFRGVQSPMSKVENQRFAILTLDFGPRDLGPTPGRDTLFHREKPEEIGPHPVRLSLAGRPSAEPDGRGATTGTGLERDGTNVGTGLIGMRLGRRSKTFTTKAPRERRTNCQV